MRGRVLLVLTLLVAPTALSATGGQDATPTRVLVSLDTWPAPSTTLETLEALDAEVVEAFPVAQTVLVAAPTQAVSALDSVPHVAHVTPDEPLTMTLDSSKAAIGITDELREAEVTGQGVNIVLIDSGVEPDHPGLDDRLIAQHAFSSEGRSDGPAGVSKHGTHVAGVLVGTGEAAAPSRGDVSGVAPGSGLVSLDISPAFTTSNALRAMEWIYQNHDERDIQVVANSWGRQREPARFEPDDPIIRASDSLVDEGLVVVFSAGNGGPDPSHMTLEGTNPSVITVGAATDDGQVERYSSRGPVYDGDQRANWTKPDVVAPGSHIVSARAGGTGPGTNYALMNGTSMAAPHVAGVASLLLSVDARLTPAQVKGLVTATANDMGPPGLDDESGAGMVDATAAIQRLERAGASVEERSRTTQEQGELTGPREAGQVLQAASVEHEERIPIDVPANATAIHGTVQWDGRAELEVRFVDPRGDVAERATIADEDDVALEDPRQGRWTIELEPTGVAQGRYQAELTVSWLERSDGVDIPIAQHRGRSGAFPSQDGPLDPFGSTWIPGVPNVVPMIAGGALTAVMLVGKLTRKPRRDEATVFERVE